MITDAALMTGKALICLALLPVTLSAASLPRRGPLKQDLSWKRYTNKTLGYCLSYPARWVRGEAFDGTGMFFETGVKKFSLPIGEMDIGVSSATDELPQLVAIHLDGIKKFQRARDMEILDRRTLNLAGAQALFTKDRYTDPLEKENWIEEFVLARYKNALYRLEMVCRAEHVERFEPMFSRFVKTFRFECNSRRSSGHPNINEVEIAPGVQHSRIPAGGGSEVDQEGIHGMDAGADRTGSQ
ncbi:MAG: hypothetical protein JO061_03950 [Acidobacteriaceae bacterium]|nr:hypothetical protein [Acidobacteriaceae bacterium]